MWNTTLAAGKNFYLCLCDWLRFCSPFSAWPANQSWPCLPARWSKVLAIPDSIPWWIAAPAAPVAYRMTGAHTKQSTQTQSVVWVYVWVRVSQSYWQTKSKRRRRRLERHQMNSLLKGHVVRPRGNTGHVANAKWCQTVRTNYAWVLPAPRSAFELCLPVSKALMNSPAPLSDVRRLGTQLYRTHRWVVAAYASWAAIDRRASHSRCRQWSDA